MPYVTADGIATASSSAADICLPFALGGGVLRGRLVRLTATVTEILNRHDDPAPVGAVLAEAMAAAVALAGGLKYAGVFTLQIQSKGPVQMLVADVTSAGELRGCVKFDQDQLTAELSRPRPEGFSPHLLSAGGHLAFTVDQGPDTQRFQGIVELTGETLTDAIHHYFRQSEQLESALKTAVAAPAAPGAPWSVAALLVQRMPEHGGRVDITPDALDDIWRTAVIFLGSVKVSELLDLSVSPEQLLTRLYGTLGVLPAGRRPILAKCRCSRLRSERILASFPVDEVRTFVQDGQIHMTCEFCRARHVFSESELEILAEKHRPASTKVSEP